MPKRTRFALAFAVLLAALLVLTLVAVGGLLALQLHGAAIAAAVAGGVAVAAVAAGHAVLRELPEATEPASAQEPQPGPPSQPLRARVSVTHPRVVQLPPAYLEAVRRGAQARHAAWRDEAQKH
jgi:hypothetical protein